MTSDLFALQKLANVFTHTRAARNAKLDLSAGIGQFNRSQPHQFRQGGLGVSIRPN
jgi:hypothetical protein